MQTNMILPFHKADQQNVKHQRVPSYSIQRTCVGVQKITHY